MTGRGCEQCENVESNRAHTDLDMSGEDAGEDSTLARLASSLWIADASEVGLAAEPGTKRTPLEKENKMETLISARLNYSHYSN